MIQDKQWWKSKTIWTAIVVCITSVAGEFGVEVPQSVFGVLGALQTAVCGENCKKVNLGSFKAENL